MNRRLFWRDFISYLTDYCNLIINKEGTYSTKCDRKLTKTKEFCLKNNLDFKTLGKELKENGGGCDCEVVLNCEDLFSSSYNMKRWERC